ncbi:leukemia inhibitory factor receptor isoform X2 [Pseudochaenichthys georgianus]|uniref:leukemia inhibitory factor receptor isoform X2 n=1 Tax=Pseudochaenichthys georgianus TaxID=52239 RepID=UPI00146AE52D|nr:interleukin-31 receptor subunit alpha isoform X2 [Pseudochaenichthys georgianus]
MVGSGFLLDFLDSKCTSYGIKSYVFLLGVILVYYTALSSHVQASKVPCKSKNFSSKYQHCEINPAGVHDLDCFGKHPTSYRCVWKPGNSASENTYTLIITQPIRHCKVYNTSQTNITKGILLYEKYNMTAEVFENSASTNCTKSVFRGSPMSLFRCGPPHNASFSRHSGKLDVSGNWQNENIKDVQYYSVRYKALGSLSWSKPLMQSKNGKKCTVENLNSSLVYSMQMQCVTNDRCPQCPWSESYTVPAELTTQPVMVNMKDTDIAKTKGRRLISLTWKFPAKEQHDSYHVIIGKASGEAPRQRMITTEPEIRLVLSYSEYHLNISAVNNASTSPAVSQTIPQREDTASTGAGKLNVTVDNNTSFTIHWKEDLIKNYVCYSVEWMERGHKAGSMSFYEDEYNHRTLTSLPEPLEPYKRYSITLHTRPDKDTCNMKKVNNSESTYGRTHFYSIEGSPLSAPTNLSFYNVSLNSVELQWLSIPEDDIRGFLLGYIIYCTEYQHGGATTERNITMDPMSNSYELRDLKDGTAYGVKISGFTEAGVGVRSTPIFFTTKYQELSQLIGVITIFAVIGIVLIFGSPVIKRAKVILWPSIPNPGKSNAMQKIEEPCELELLGSINHLEEEEWDTNSLKIVEKQEVIPASPLSSMLPLLHASDDEEEDSTEMTCNWIQGDTGDSTEEIPSDIAGQIIPDINRIDPQSSPFTFPCDYTTIEMFQQGIPQSMPARTSFSQDTESDPEDTEWTVVKSGLDYMSQFSTSPILDGKEISRIL